MGIELAFTAIKDLFINTSIFGLGWLILVIITVMSVFLISREANNWKHLAFPVIIGWYTSGLKSYTLFDAILLVSTGIMFVVETLSVGAAGKILETIQTKATDIATRTTKETRDIIQQAKTAARNKTYTGIFERTTGKGIREDIIKSAGRIRGQGITNYLQATGTKTNRTNRQIEATREEKKKERLRELKQKALIDSTKHAMDIAPADTEMTRINWTERLADAVEGNMLTKKEADKLTPKKNKYRERAPRVWLKRQEIANKIAEEIRKKKEKKERELEN